MKLHRRRTAFSLTCSMVGALLIALWIHSHRKIDSFTAPNSSTPESAAKELGTESKASPTSNLVAQAAAKQAGVGIALRIDEGKVFVNKVLPDSPAAASKLIQPNDQIISIAEADNKPIEVSGTKDVAKVVGMIRGPIGTVVRLAIVPAGKDDADEVVVSLMRGDIKQIDSFVDGRLLPVGSKPPNFKFTRLNDKKEMQLSEFTGHVIVIEFWASWCGPCLKANEYLDSIGSQHPEWKDQVELLAVSIDENETEALASFTSHHWPNLTVAWAGPDAAKLYRISALPTTFVVDRNGLVAAVDHRLDIPTVIEPLLSTVAR